MNDERICLGPETKTKKKMRGTKNKQNSLRSQENSLRNLHHYYYLLLIVCLFVTFVSMLMNCPFIHSYHFKTKQQAKNLFFILQIRVSRKNKYDSCGI